jgi:protein-tyrosine phosphatase
VERGVLAQVTSGSFLGQFGSGIQRAAEQFLEQGLVHVLATDAHSAVGRPPTLSEGVRQAERIVGDRAWEMATIIPSAILSDTLLEVEPPRAKKKAHRFW